MNRRQYLTTITVGVTGVAGCAGGNSSPGIQIEYNLSDPKTAEEVPDDVVGHPNPEGFYWIVVEFELVSGSFDASDIMGLTQVEAGGSSHFTRAVIITSPDDVRLTSPDDEYSISEGTIGQAYYRFSERPEDPVWVVEQLRNQYGSVEMSQSTKEDTTKDTYGDGGGNQGGEETNENGLIFDEGQTHSFSGDGMTETAMFELDEGLMSVKYQSEADDVFTAELVAIDVKDSSHGVDDRLILNRMAPIKGELMNIVSGGTYLIDIDVDGPWSFKIDQPSASYDEVMELPFERSGHQPVYFGPINLPENALIHGKHSGEGGFTVDSITVDGHWDVPINDSSRKVDSTRPMRDDGIAWISVTGRGDWSINIYERES